MPADTATQTFLSALLNDVNVANLNGANDQLEDMLATYFTPREGRDSVDAVDAVKSVNSLRDVGVATMLEFETSGTKVRIPKIAFAPRQALFIDALTLEGRFGRMSASTQTTKIESGSVPSTKYSSRVRLGGGVGSATFKISLRTEERTLLLEDTHAKRA